MNDNSNLVKDFRCPECGEMLDSHVVTSRHSTGKCDENFTGPELGFACVSKLDMADCTVTEREGAMAAFEKIMAMVAHDSPVYQIASEQLSWLKAFNG